MNGFRTTILLAALTALVVWIGQMFGGPNGAVMALDSGRRDEFLQLLVQRQDRSQNVRRARDYRQRRSGALWHRAGFGGQGRFADAEGLRDSGGDARTLSPPGATRSMRR